MMIAYVPVLVALAGGLVHALASNPKVSEMGRIAFFVGLLWMVYAMSNHSLRLG